jgi:DNA-binding beta-propeller fold protein YncE
VGTEPGQFRHPQGLAVDGQGNILVADSHNSRLQLFSPLGSLLAVWGEERDGHGTEPPRGHPPPSAPGQFDHPADVAVDHGGSIYVADTRNARVQKLSPTGQVLAVWHRDGQGNDAFECPEGIAVGGEGNVYVADNNATSRIIKLSPLGRWLAVWPLPHDDDGGYVHGVAVAVSGDVFVTLYCDANTPCLHRLDPDGKVTAILN